MKFKQTPVEIPVANQIMRGTLYRPEGDGLKPGIVIFHGRGSQQSRHTDRAAALAAAGFITLVFSFRGCGESDGKLANQTIAMGLEDALAGYDFLVAQPGVEINRIGVVGGSFGGYLAAILTERRPVHSLVLVVPAIYKDEWWKLVPETKTNEWKKYSGASAFSATKAIQAIKKYAGPFLLIEHEFDEVCPKKLTQAYFENATLASPKERALVEGVGHRWVEAKHRDQSIKFSVDWFRKTL